METKIIAKNWAASSTPSILKNIHQKDINIAIYNRDIDLLKKEVNTLISQGVDFKLSGEIHTIQSEISKVIDPIEFYMLFKDIKYLLYLFKKVTGNESVRLLLATIDTNMCTKFHADVNDLRMLCTYTGPGTLWLTEDNINRKALSNCENNESIVINQSNIQQVKTGNVVILKGAKYQRKTTKGAVHRSPTMKKKKKDYYYVLIQMND